MIWYLTLKFRQILILFFRGSLAIPSKHWEFVCHILRWKPTKILSLYYVWQCWVLVQIISEKVTAMKLAACPNWARIIFDATTCRQVPFSAVVISLVGDGPKTIDPVIISSCVDLEDKTSEMQMDGIVTKVRVASSQSKD